MNDSQRNRIKGVRQQLKKNKTTSLLITDSANVTYTTGFSGHDSWCLITNRNVYLITDSRYTEQAEKECVNCRIIARAGPMSQAVAGVLKKLTSINIMAIEKSASIAAFQAIKKNTKVKLKPLAGIVESVRTIKDDGEIKAIKTAALIAAKALRYITGKIRPGILENQLAALLDFNIRKLGATNSFETIVAFGANASRPHHQPTKRKLKKNDTVLIDFGARYKGYCSDITRCFTVGKPSTFYKKVYEVVRLAQAAAIEMIKPGVEIKKVDAAARKIIAQSNLPVYGHGTGHGLGLCVHEGPVVGAKTKGKFQAGMVVTIEPGIYIPQKLGIRIEDDILVTKTGCQILTQTK